MIKAASVLTTASALGVLGAGRVSAQNSAPGILTDGGGILAGETAIVTGAARGIGRAIALALAGAGANIVAVDIASNLPFLQYDLATQYDLSTTAHEIEKLGVKALPVTADVRDGNAMQGVAEQALAMFHRIDMLVANAGIQIYGVPLVETPEDHWRLILDVNLTGAANSMRAVLPQMIKQNGGRIVALTSVEGRMGDKGSASYSSTKWGLIGLVKSLVEEVGPYYIRVNGISPATVSTKLTENQASYAATNPQNPTRQGWIEANLAMNSLPVPYLLPQDIADAALWVLSPAARLVTGAAFDIAIGRNARYTA